MDYLTLVVQNVFPLTHPVTTLYINTTTMHNKISYNEGIVNIQQILHKYYTTITTMRGPAK